MFSKLYIKLLYSSLVLINFPLSNFIINLLITLFSCLKGSTDKKMLSLCPWIKEFIDDIVASSSDVLPHS